MNQEIPFKVFSNCILVKGFSRSTICDLQRNKTHLIPNILFDILQEFQGKTVNDVKLEFANEHDEIIDEYFSFLEVEELIFYTTTPDWFPPLDLQWHYPFDVSNCIIDINEYSDFDFHLIFKSLDSLSCRFVEIRSYYDFSMNFYQQLVDHVKDTTITSIGLIVPSDALVTLEMWETFCDANNRITSLIIHSDQEDRINYSPKFQVPISFTTSKVLNEKSCGKINERYFISYLDNFTESLFHNTCLNRKISIAVNGDIKNCPSMKETFGNIKHVTLESAIEQPGFKDKWHITKNEIKVCKDCEFRHICTDCRAYLENPSDIYSKPLKCGYDPYSCQWEDWSTSPIKQKAIDYYGLAAF